MLSRFNAIRRIPDRILSTPRLGAASVRTIIIDSSASERMQSEPGAVPTAPNDAMSLWGKMEFETNMTDSGKVRITHRGNIIPEGKWENGTKKLNDRWNKWLVVAIAGWIITTYIAVTEYNLYPSGYFPLCICKDQYSATSYLNYKADSNVYIQHYDDLLPEVEEDEEEEEEDED